MSALFSRIRALPKLLLLAVAVITALVMVTVLGISAASAPRQGSAVGIPTVAPLVLARGQVRPVAHARIGTLSGGTLVSLAAEVGEAVQERQEIARVRAGSQTEVLTAPWAGTITGIPAHVGDTLTPGATVATVGDLRRLQIETTDVDEFIVVYVARGQEVTVTVDALEDREYRGYVQTVTFEPRITGDGDEHYPVVIDLAESTADLRPGMSVRIDFSQSQRD